MSNPVLVLLWVIWAALLFGGLVVGAPDERQTVRMPRWMRLASSLVLVAAAWGVALIYRDTPNGDLILLTAVGMTLGFVGDVFMAMPILASDMNVFGGIGAFGVGHVAYILALAGAADRLGLDSPAPRWVALALTLVIGGVCWYIVVLRGSPKPSALHWAALPYALLLAATAGMAGGLALQDPRFIPVAVGGILFLTSDLILAAQLFNQAYFRWIGDWIWLTYGPAQMLIVYGMGLALSGSSPQ